jgi:hypothetical protein
MIDGEPNKSNEIFKVSMTTSFTFRTNGLRMNQEIKMSNAPFAVRGPAQEVLSRIKIDNR